MTSPARHDLEIPGGFRSPVAALFLAQLDDQSRRLAEDTRELTAAALAWQPRSGVNSMGMLLAHIAFWEVFWTKAVLEADPAPAATADVLGITMADVGTPLAADAGPALAGRDLAQFDDWLARARAHLRSVAARLTDADLVRVVRLKRLDGTLHDVTPRWALYHLLEHEAQHVGQVLLLRHQWRAVAAQSSAGR